MNHVVFIFICLSASICSAQTEKKISLGEQPIYKAKKALTTITVDGKLNKDEWVNAEVRTLDYFYRIEQASDQQKTTFRMLWDEHNIYLFYEMKDKYLTACETQRDGEPYLDDCAEIFFITAPDSLDTHFGFELNLQRWPFCQNDEDHSIFCPNEMLPLDLLLSMPLCIFSHKRKKNRMYLLIMQKIPDLPSKLSFPYRIILRLKQW